MAIILIDDDINSNISKLNANPSHKSTLMKYELVYVINVQYPANIDNPMEIMIDRVVLNLMGILIPSRKQNINKVNAICPFCAISNTDKPFGLECHQ